MSSSADGTRVDTHNQGYNLYYGRRIECTSPFVGRHSRNPARNVNTCNRVSGNPVPMVNAMIVWPVEALLHESQGVVHPPGGHPVHLHGDQSAPLLVNYGKQAVELHNS